MADDIVARLREWSEGGSVYYESVVDMREAADEIERLRELSGDSGKLREERDEARQEICLLRSSSTNATEKVSFEMIAYAASRGWDDLFADTGNHERDA